MAAICDKESIEHDNYENEQVRHAIVQLRERLTVEFRGFPGILSPGSTPAGVKLESSVVNMIRLRNPNLAATGSVYRRIRLLKTDLFQAGLLSPGSVSTGLRRDDNASNEIRLEARALAESGSVSKKHRNVFFPCFPGYLSPGSMTTGV